MGIVRNFYHLTGFALGAFLLVASTILTAALASHLALELQNQLGENAWVCTFPYYRTARFGTLKQDMIYTIRGSLELKPSFRFLPIRVESFICENKKTFNRSSLGCWESREPMRMLKTYTRVISEFYTHTPYA